MLRDKVLGKLPLFNDTVITFVPLTFKKEDIHEYTINVGINFNELFTCGGYVP